MIHNTIEKLWLELYTPRVSRKALENWKVCLLKKRPYTLQSLLWNSDYF